MNAARPGASPLRSDVVGGMTTFFTMAYIVVVNPAILSANGATGMPFGGVLTATVLICFVMTLAMGLYARLPYGVAPGMGINAFFAYTLVLGQKIPWETALGMVFWAGVLFLLISVFPIREAIARGIPESLRVAAAGGIGIFLTFIGLKNAGLVVADPATLVKLGSLGVEQLLFVCGLGLAAWLLRKKSAFAFLAAMGAVTLAGMAMGKVKPPESLFSAPDFQSVFLKADLMGALKLSLLPAMISILFTDLFDSLSTFVGVSRATGMVDKEGNPLRLKQGLIVDAFATLGAGLAGTSSGTAFIESAAGIEAGGRSGRAAVVTALCFLPCLFLAPLAGAIPAFATAPVLVLVGALMFRSVRSLEVEHLEDILPAYLTLVLIPLTFSITQGMLWGFLAHVILYAAVGRAREVRPVMWGVAGISALLLAFAGH